MKSEPFRIFYTEKKPFTTAGKRIPSLWKNADSFHEFFSLLNVEKSPVKTIFSMMYDRENLYISAKYTMPESMRNRADSPVPEKPYFQTLFSLGRDSGKRILKFMVREEGNCELLLDGETKEDPAVKYSVFTRNIRTGYCAEITVSLPFSLLERTAPAAGEKLFINAVLSRRDPDWECLREWNILTPLETLYGMENHWICGVFTEKQAEPVCRSATEELQNAYGTATITLDPGTCSPEPYKNILGMNNSPRIRSAAYVEMEKSLFRKLGPARVRHHDAPLTDPGFALVDVSRIFPLFRADHHDPENYDFGPTDLCFRHVADCGVPIEFRFGESIEHSGTTFRVNPPEDPQKWAEICVNILRHYNEGWHNGMKLNIRYASLWEEPDGIFNLFTGPFEKYLTLYKCFATEMKKAFPDVKVGGPQAIALEKIDEFLAFCRKNDLPVDFVSKTAYNRRLPADFSDQASAMRALAEKHGFTDAEIFIAEWHLCPRSWKKSYLEDTRTTENAAFSAASLILMQNIVDMAYFYGWASPGFYCCFSEPESPYKVFYALCFYTEFIRKNGKILPAKMKEEQPGNYSLASVDENGTAFLLLSRYISVTDVLEIQLPEEYCDCRMKIVSDDSPDGSLIRKFRRKNNGKFRIDFAEKSYGVYLLEFEKKK